jgi:predicted nucleic acid-binding protein
MSHFTALYDACVLYPAPLRDLLMRLALEDLYRARWTDRIHDEWIRSVLKDRQDLSRDQLERTRNLMNAHVRDCLVTGYEDLIEGLELPDPDDRHVLAAAIRTRASVIVTFNLGRLPGILSRPIWTGSPTSR